MDLVFANVYFFIVNYELIFAFLFHKLLFLGLQNSCKLFLFLWMLWVLSVYYFWTILKKVRAVSSLLTSLHPSHLTRPHPRAVGRKVIIISNCRVSSLLKELLGVSWPRTRISDLLQTHRLARGKTDLRFTMLIIQLKSTLLSLYCKSSVGQSINIYWSKSVFLCKVLKSLIFVSIVMIVCRDSIMLTTSDFQSGRSD